MLVILFPIPSNLNFSPNDEPWGNPMLMILLPISSNLNPNPFASNSSAQFPCICSVINIRFMAVTNQIH